MKTPETTATSPGHTAGISLVLLLGAVTALGPFSTDMYLPAIPTMGRQLQASPTAVQMTLAIFAIGSGLGQLVFGPISDRFGRRWPALIGLVLYVLASAGCALAANVESMIAFRLLQALGVCSGQVAARALLADMYAPRELARVSSLLSMITLAAPVIGPLAGGYLFTAFGWRPLFWVLALYGLIVTAACFFRLPETRTLEARALSRGESALASYVAVVRNWPLMQMGLAAACGMCGLFVYIASSAHMLIEHFRVPPEQFGWYFAANSVGLFIGANFNRILLKRREPADILRWTCLIYLATTVLVLGGAYMPQLGKFGVLVPLFLMIATFPAVMGNTQAIAQGYDRQRAGAVAAVLGALSALLGGTAMIISSAVSDGTPRAMAWTMVGGATLCVLLFYGGPRQKTKA